MSTAVIEAFKYLSQPECTHGHTCGPWAAECEWGHDDLVWPLSVLMMQMSADKGISAFPESDNLFKWIGTIDGAQGTVRTNTHTRAYTHIQTHVDKHRRIFHKHHLCSPASQVYDGLRYRLSLEFPAGYPYQAPRVKFVTPCFHPNVDEQGFICLDILKDKWSALYDVRSILLSIQSLLGGNQFNQFTLTNHWKIS